MSKINGSKLARRRLKNKINEFLVEHGLKEIDTAGGLRRFAQCLSHQAGTPPRGTNKRVLARAVYQIFTENGGKLPLRYQPTIKAVHSPRLISRNVAYSFYQTEEWKLLSEQMLLKYGRVCMRCKTTRGPMHVDHIKPVRKYWKLRLDSNNLQILCAGCNYNKGNRDETDYRQVPCLGSN